MADRKLLKRWWALVDSNHRLNIVSTSCRSADDILDVKKRW